MIRVILALAAVTLLAAPAEAGRRCYRSYQTIYSLNGWNHSCYQCHPRKSQARDPKDLLAGLASKLSGDAAWYKEFNALTSGYAQRGGYASATAYAGGYQTTTAGEYSSYPVGGNSLYGVQSYSSHPLLDLNAAAGTLGKVVEQTNTGAQNLISGYGNFTATAYALDSQRQENIAAYQAILGVRQGPAVQARAEVFRYQTTTEPNAAGGQAGAGQSQNAPQQAPPPHPGLVVLNQRCVDCHSPNGQFGVHGAFDLSKLDLKMVQAAADRVSLPPGDAKAMPRVKTAEGFGPGEALPWNEIRAVQDLALGVPAR